MKYRKIVGRLLIQILPLLPFLSVLIGQSLELHYDMGEDRKYATTTLEMFTPDAFGATFWFVDMDYNAGSEEAVSLMYWEIARYFHTPVSKISATVQYNDGVAEFGNLGQVWLAGISRSFDFGSGLQCGIDLLYRQENGLDENGQCTITWVYPVADGRVTISGFCDIWTTEGGANNIVYLTEPQCWVRLNQYFSLGGEIEISRNFLDSNDTEIMPTIGVKWNF